MSNGTKIEWTDEVWNPVTGCTKAGPGSGCKNCYAEREWVRLSHNPKTVYFGRKFTDVSCHPERLDHPLRWTRPRMIFVNSMSDLFHDDVPYDFILDIFMVMAAASEHTFQVLTKRPERMRQFMSHITQNPMPNDVWEASLNRARWFDDADGMHDFILQQIKRGFPNVWLGVSIEDQETADLRIPILLDTPAAIRWISAEPLLGPVDLERTLWFAPHDGHLEHRVDVLRGGYWNRAPHIMGAPSAGIGDPKGGFTNHSDMPSTLDWVVVGGESGHKARPMHPDWVRSLRDQCGTAGVPFLFKQWGEWCPSDQPHMEAILSGTDAIYDKPDTMRRVGKKSAGRLLDAKLWDNYPNGGFQK